MLGIALGSILINSGYLIASVTTSDVIAMVEASILLATLIVIYVQDKQAHEQVEKQIAELSKDIRRAAHSDLYDKLLRQYYIFVEQAQDLSGIYKADAGNQPSDIKKRHMIYAILDILYFMYLQKDLLDPRLSSTWRLWAARIFEEPKIREVYEEIKSEYPDTYINEIETLHARQNDDMVKGERP